MRTNLVELTPELLDQDPRIDPILEPLHRQALIAQLAVERLVRTVLPRLARIDEGCVDMRFLGQPLQYTPGLRTLGRFTREQILWRAVNADEPGKHVDDSSGSDGFPPRLSPDISA